MTEKLYKTFICCGECSPSCGQCHVQQTIEYTPEEYAQAKLDAIASAELRASQEAEAAAKAEAKASAEAKLAALGLTPDEIAAIK